MEGGGEGWWWWVLRSEKIAIETELPPTAPRTYQSSSSSTRSLLPGESSCQRLNGHRVRVGRGASVTFRGGLVLRSALQSTLRPQACWGIRGTENEKECYRKRVIKEEAPKMKFLQIKSLVQ